MPTYQYACTECGHQLEAVQSFSDATLTECPDCHGKLRKVFNSVGIVFKGSGFYRNDSRPGEVTKEKAANGAEAAPAAAGANAGDAGGGGDKKKTESTSAPAAASSSTSSAKPSSSSSTSTAA